MRHNHAAIVGAVIASFLFGFVWYSLPFIQQPWAPAWSIDLAGLEPPGAVTFIVPLLGLVVEAYVLSWLIGRLGIATAAGGVALAAVLWLGLQLPATASHYIFGGPGTAAIVIDSLNSLATASIIGAVLGWRQAPEAAVVDQAVPASS